MSSQPPIRMQVHGREDSRIDGILALIEESSRVAPLAEILERMAAQVAKIAHADVVSVYVREQESGRPVFVLRANVGFAHEMVGHVKLELGEGLTGFAAECLRPVSADVAQKDAHYKHFPDLGEERFPSFLALPLVMGGQAIGVLDLQRGEGGDFSPAEVALCAALATPFTLALDRACSDPVEVGRSARLTGNPLGGGRSMGQAQSMLTFRALREPTGAGSDAADAVREAVARVHEQVVRTLSRLDAELLPDDRRALAVLQITLQDQRLLSLMADAVGRLGIVAGLRRVARDYVAAPYMLSGEGAIDPWLSARAGEIEGLCLWIAAGACDEPGPGPGVVSVGAEGLGAFGLLWHLARGVSGIVLGGEVEANSLVAALARAAKLPVVTEVAGLFAWVRSGDTLLVDAERGVIRVNPSASILAQVRHGR